MFTFSRWCTPGLHVTSHTKGFSLNKKLFLLGVAVLIILVIIVKVVCPLLLSLVSLACIKDLLYCISAEYESIQEIFFSRLIIQVQNEKICTKNKFAKEKMTGSRLFLSKALIMTKGLTIYSSLVPN